MSLTRARVSQLKAAGLPMSGHLVAVERARKWYGAHFQEDLKRGPGGGDAQLLDERTRVRIDLQKAQAKRMEASAEVSLQDARIKSRELVPRRATRLLVCRLLADVRQRIWAVPLKFIHHLTKEHANQVQLDETILRAFEDAFRLSNHKDFARENAYVLAKADLVIQICEADLVMAEHDGRDKSTAETCLRLAREVRSLFFEMRPELIRDLGIKMFIRGEGRPEDEWAGESGLSEEGGE